VKRKEGSVVSTGLSVLAARYGMAGSLFDHKAARLHKCGLLGAILAAWLNHVPKGMNMVFPMEM
jgi:hypothetical protein